MEISKTLEQAIKDKNLTGLHSVFYTILHEDPAFVTDKFKQTLQYVQSKNIEGFIENFEGTPFLPEEEWNEAYWAHMASELQDNFSKERISHIEAVGKKIYGNNSVEKILEDNDNVVKQKTNSRTSRQNGNSERKNNNSPQKQHIEENSLNFFAICSAVALAAYWIWKRRK